MSEKSPWAADTDTFVPHESPAIPDFVGTDITAADDGLIIVNRMQDVEPILEYCKEKARTDSFRSPSNEMHHLMEIPDVVQEQYLKETGISYHELLLNPVHVKAIMADPRYSHFLIAANSTHKVYR